MLHGCAVDVEAPPYILFVNWTVSHSSDLLDSLKDMKRLIEKGNTADVYAVRYGKYDFSSIEEFGAWAEVVFKEGVYPFGAFVDVYSLL